MIFLREPPRRTGYRGLLEISTAPPPSVDFMNPFMNLLMTTYAQTLQITLVMGAPLRQWFDMMHKLSCLEPPLTLASFTKRMAIYIAVPNLSPGFTVTLVMIVATCKMLVVVLHQFPMVFAVAALVVSQFWTATKPAWPLGFHRHFTHLRPRKTPLRGFSLRGNFLQYHHIKFCK